MGKYKYYRIDKKIYKKEGEKSPFFLGEATSLYEAERLVVELNDLRLDLEEVKKPLDSES